MHWYNPITRSVEDTSTPITDEEATKRLRDNISSEAFLTVYDRLRAEGMAIEQALIFVGHHFRLRGCADRRVANVSMGDEEPT
jgi:hypothetical protein